MIVGFNTTSWIFAFAGIGTSVNNVPIKFTKIESNKLKFNPTITAYLLEREILIIA